MYQKAAAFQLGLLSSTFKVNVERECKVSMAPQQKAFSVPFPKGCLVPPATI